MRIRNRKTGKVYELMPIMRVYEVGKSKCEYIPLESLKAMHKEWKDYKPTRKELAKEFKK